MSFAEDVDVDVGGDGIWWVRLRIDPDIILLNRTGSYDSFLYSREKFFDDRDGTFSLCYMQRKKENGITVSYIN